MVYLGCVFIMLISAYLGKEISNKYVIRSKFYRHLKNMCIYFKNNISFTQSKINDLFDSYIKLNEQGFYNETIEFKNYCISFDKNNTKICKMLSFLKNDEVKLIVSHFDQLGNSSQNIEQEKLDVFIKYLDYQLIEKEKKQKEMQGLTYKLCLMVGLVLCIILI